MKTKEQILDWLDKQPWKGEFYEEVFLNGYGQQIPYNEDFIINVFCWNVTKAGSNVWEQRHKNYLQWYNEAGRPTTWEEYCRQNPINAGDCYIDETCSIDFAITSSSKVDRNADTDVNVMPKDLCEAFLAYMKLIQLRNLWVSGGDASNCTVKIVVKYDDICKDSYIEFVNGLSFPTAEMADEFKDTFKDLLEVAKPLL